MSVSVVLYQFFVFLHFHASVLVGVSLPCCEVVFTIKNWTIEHRYSCCLYSNNNSNNDYDDDPIIVVVCVILVQD